jgi:hypothetical protein
MAEKSQGRPAPGRRRDDGKRFTDAYYGATIRVPVAFTTAHMRRCYNRLFDTTSRHVFFCRFYANLAGGDQAVDQMSARIREAMAAADKELDKRLGMADGLMQKMQIKFDYVAKPATASTAEAIIVDPLARHYLKLLEKAERLSQRLQAIWLDTGMNDGQYRQANNEVAAILRRVFLSAQKQSYELQDRWREIERNGGAGGRAEPESKPKSAASDTDGSTEAVGKPPVARLGEPAEPEGLEQPGPAEMILEKKAA